MTQPPAKRLLPPLLLAALVGLAWAFPAFWYNRPGDGQTRWFAERSDLPSWTFHPVPVDASAEKVLVADRSVNGEFRNAQGQVINVFSAKRYEEKANEIGLFIHTPDRCWVEAGWKLEAAAPDVRQISLHGAPLSIERRIFDYRGRRELVYFFGLIGGRPLPYRLDHYFAAGLRSAGQDSRKVARASDRHFWERLWDSFQSRRQMGGPKQFVRVSTEVGLEDPSAADARLESFLLEWLAPSDFDEEKSRWKMAASAKADSAAAP